MFENFSTLYMKGSIQATMHETHLLQASLNEKSIVQAMYMGQVWFKDHAPLR